MAKGERETGTDGLIDGAYRVDTTRPLGDIGGGLPAFVVRDAGGERTDLMAVEVRPTAPARAPTMVAFPPPQRAGFCAPVAFGRAVLTGGRYGLFAVGQAPVGAPLVPNAERLWTEPQLIARVVRPAAAALEAIRSRELTHRAIRPGNVFGEGAGEPLQLGQFWAAPAASLQPAVFEPPYVAMCRPDARGEGTIADDVYALGVLILSLAIGRVPMAGLDADAVVRRKLELGGFEAMVGDERLAPGLADLICSMVAEDPDHRPTPALLADPAAARARRMAARTATRAQRPITVGEHAITEVRGLAYALSRDAAQAGRLLRTGTVERWLRRELGDTATAGRIEEFVKIAAESTGSEASRAEAVLTMRTAAVLDPFAPLVWRGLAMWPDAVATVVAALPGEGEDTRIDEILDGEVIVTWAQLRPGTEDISVYKQEARQHRAWMRMPGWSGGRSRVRYGLNALLACASPRLEAQAIHRIADLVHALEASLGTGEGDASPLDREIVAFVAARHDQRSDADLALLHRAGAKAEPGNDEVERANLALLRVLAGLQTRHAPHARLARVAGRMARMVTPLTQSWRKLARRQAAAERLERAAAAGDLPAMVVLLDDPQARQLDDREAQEAERAVHQIDLALARIAAAAPARAERALRLGTELAAAVGATALLTVLIAAAVA